jgi:cobalt-precorrin 5A hydrolase/precorrin-3B C17-methyltransferase
MSGILYGIGVGPGDPELMTLKGIRVLARVPVIAYPAPEGGASLARAIAAPHIPEGKIEVELPTPMVPGLSPHHESYDRHAEALSVHLAAGKDVAVLCEGDPFLYGSFVQLFERLAPRFPVEVVPGISSLLAGPAQAKFPLAVRAESLAVIPATLPEDEIARCARAADSVVVLKAGRHLEKIRAALARAGFGSDAIRVTRATLPDQRIAPLAEAEGDAPYFTLVLARRETEAATEETIPEGAALVALTAEGARLARTIQARLPGSSVHGLEGRVENADTAFADAAQHLRALFGEGKPVVGICAAGILVRALAPLLADKAAEPPVVAVSADGRFAVPILGGHRGANRLARAIAESLGGSAAVTTAGEAALGLALDDPPPGWRAGENRPEAGKRIAAALIAGDPVRLRVEAGNAGWLVQSGARFADRGALAVRITDRAVAGDANTFVLHPPTLALGVGCERGTAPGEAIALAETALAQAGLAPASIACVVSTEAKMDEEAIHAVAAHFRVPARFFAPGRLEEETPRLVHPSPEVFRAVGSHGVAEAAALAASGSQGALAVPKTKSARATAAVGRAAPGRVIAGETVGRARGRLAVVGIGPGDPAWRTPEATRILRESTDVVGYSLYLDLAADAIAGKRRHESRLSEEEARARLALDLAAEGRAVALVSSGDPGIYALAALVFELLDGGANPRWGKVEVNVVPGVSAMQAAAARLGAPLGHDFCAISLSDLLTPWSEIERRLEAAGRGDFVVALYNPVSQRRTRQLLRARDILLQHRPSRTPVILARNLGREAETVETIALSELDPARADMLTLVIVGARRTRAFAQGRQTRVYTPRGYATKREKDIAS